MTHRTIDFAEGLRLPIELATLPIALLAQKGRGKTYAAKRLAEAFFLAGVPPVILDSVGVWYGLRLAKNGKDRGLDIPILGGQHGDAPLLPTAGAVVAEALVQTSSPAILDTTAFESEADVRRFMTAFAERFFRLKARKRSPVHLFLEEADDWIPQNPERDEIKMLGAFQRIARKGRNFGIGMTVISQRPQGVSKKVLNLTDALVVLGLTAARERDAIADWMDDKEIDEKQREKALDALPRLGWNPFKKHHGGALIWWPMGDVFGTYGIRPIETFDSSATPEIGKSAQEHELAKLDVSALGAAIQATVEEAKANDPRELRAELARVKAQLGVKRVPAPAKAERIEVPVLKADQVHRLEKLVKTIDLVSKEAATSAAELQSAIPPALELARELRQLLAKPNPLVVPRPEDSARNYFRSGVVEKISTALRPVPNGSGHVPTEGPLDKGSRVILVAIAQRPGGVTREQLGVVSGYRRSSRNTYLQRLQSRGAIVIQGDRITATAAAVEILGTDYQPLPTGDALRSYWLERLSGGEQRILRLVTERYPEALARSQIDEATGYRRSSRNTYLQRLLARKLVVTSGEGAVRASDLLYDRPV